MEQGGLAVDKKYAAISNSIWEGYGKYSGLQWDPYDTPLDRWFDERTGTLVLILPRCAWMLWSGYGGLGSYGFVLRDGRVLETTDRIFEGRRSWAFIWRDSGTAATVQDLLVVCRELTEGGAEVVNFSDSSRVDVKTWYTQVLHLGAPSRYSDLDVPADIKNIVWQLFPGDSYVEERYLEEHIYDRVFDPGVLSQVHADWIPGKPSNPGHEPGFRWFGASPLFETFNEPMYTDYLYGHCLNCGRFSPGSVEQLVSGYTETPDMYGFVCDECRDTCSSCGRAINPGYYWDSIYDGVLVGDETVHLHYSSNHSCECVCFDCGAVYCFRCANDLLWSGVNDSFGGLTAARCPRCGHYRVLEYLAAGYAPYFTTSEEWYWALEPLCPKMYSGRLAPMPGSRFVGWWNSLDGSARKSLYDSIYQSGRNKASNGESNGFMVFPVEGLNGMDVRRHLKRLDMACGGGSL